jgi:hypothetical protein
MVDEILQLIVPYMASTMQNINNGTLACPAAVQLALLRCCSAILALMHASHTKRHAEFIRFITQQCAQIIRSADPLQSASNGTTSLLVDFDDAMRCVLLKEAARLWVGVSFVCSTVSAQDNNNENQSSDRNVLVEVQNIAEANSGELSLSRRLLVCLSSPSLEVRAGAAKAAAGLLGTLQARWVASFYGLGIYSAHGICFAYDVYLASGVFCIRCILLRLVCMYSASGI